MPKGKDLKEPGVADPPAGKIAHDQRGNAVWQWSQGSGQAALDSTSRMLKQLEVPGLALLDEAKAEEAVAEDASELMRRKRESGFNPYEVEIDPNRPPPAPQAPPPRAASQPVRPAGKPVAKPAAAPAKPAATPKPGFIGRLFGKDRG